MKLPHRRQFLHLAAGAAALPAMSRAAWAQTYPSRPVRIIIGVPAGGSGDILARLVAQSLQERLGQPFVVESRPGAGTNLAIETVVRAAPDGYTLLLTGPSAAINATLYGKLNYNFVQDIAPVASIIAVPNVLVVHPTVPAKTVPELIAYTRANPAKLNMASSGVGLSGHLAGELFKMMADVNMLHVPYRGEAPAFTDLLGGSVQVMFGVLPASLGHVRDGRLRALAVTSANRSEALPDVPSVAEFLTGFETTVWFGICAPKNTPSEIINRLNKATNEALGDPKLRTRLADFTGVPSPMTPAEFESFIAVEIEKFGKVIKFAGIKAE
jgi:tripartite-type tricarboxylate transporter receptor subunit TctC